MDGWMEGWMGGSQSRVKDCLQQSIKTTLNINSIYFNNIIIIERKSAKF